MSGHQFVRDPSVSIVRGMPLSEEPGLGELTLCGFIRQVAERFSDREALVARSSRRQHGALVVPRFVEPFG